MTAQQIFDLLHGHIGAFGQARVDRYRAKAGLRLREIKGETPALARWVMENRERIEEDAVWAEARSKLVTKAEAVKAVRQLVAHALGGEITDKGWLVLDSPGYDVGVAAGISYWGLVVTINIRTDNDKLVYFPWEPTPEQTAAAEMQKKLPSWQSKDPQVVRLGKIKQPLTSLFFKLTLDDKPFGTGEYDAPPTITEAQFRAEDAADKYVRLEWDGSERTEEKAREKAEYSRLQRGRKGQGKEESDSRMSVPVLESGEATFALNFRHAPDQQGANDIIRTVPGVTLETLADTIYNMIGVGFPASPYFHG